MTPRPPFRLGTTSYILADDILPNVRHLAGQVQDVELLLFEPEAGQAPLSDEVVDQLADLAHQFNLTYTVHLPLDLRLGARGTDGETARAGARRAIECARALNPWAYIVHLDSRGTLSELSPDPGGAEWIARQAWQDRTCESLLRMAEWAGGADRLALENLEGNPPDLVAPILERLPATRCVDIGHLWLDRLEPLPYLEEALPRLRVIHLHGVAARDHTSLGVMEPMRLDPVVDWICRHFTGVVTLEVFGEADYVSSRGALEDSMRRMTNLPIKG